MVPRGSAPGQVNRARFARAFCALVPIGSSHTRGETGGSVQQALDYARTAIVGILDEHRSHRLMLKTSRNAASGMLQTTAFELTEHAAHSNVWNRNI